MCETAANQPTENNKHKVNRIYYTTHNQNIKKKFTFREMK